MKKSVSYLFILSFVLVLSLSLVSAGWFSNIFGKISGNQVKFVSPTVDACSSISDSMRQTYFTLFGADGWSANFNSHPLNALGDEESVGSAVDRYDLQGFQILDVKYYYNNGLDKTICVNDLQPASIDSLGVKISGSLDTSKLVCSGANCKDYWIKVKINTSCFNELGISNDAVLGMAPVGEDSINNPIIKDSERCNNLKLLAGDKSERAYIMTLGDTIESSEILINNFAYDESIVFSPVSYNGIIYVVANNILYAIKENQGVIWNYSSSAIYGNPQAYDLNKIPNYAGNFYQPIISDEGILYVGTSEGKVLAFDLNYNSNSPTIKWTSEKRGMPVKLSIKGNYLIYGSPESEVVLLNRETGQKIWNYSEYKTLSGSINSYPIIDESKVYVTRTGNSRSVIALDLTTGTKIWEKILAGSSISKSVAVQGDLVYVGTYGGIHALNKNTGEIVWEKAGSHLTQSDQDSNKYFGNIIGAPLIVGDKVYFSTSKASAFALDKNTGFPLESYFFENVIRNNLGTGEYYYMASPVVYKNYLILLGGKTDARELLVIFDISTGKIIEKFSLVGITDSTYTSSPSLFCMSYADSEVPSSSPSEKSSSGNFADWLTRIIASLGANPPTFISSSVQTGCSGNSCTLLNDGNKLILSLTDVKISLSSVSNERVSFNIQRGNDARILNEPTNLGVGSSYSKDGFTMQVKEIKNDETDKTKSYVLFEYSYVAPINSWKKAVSIDVNGWTMYLNRDKPGANGDDESLSLLKEEYDLTPCGEIQDIRYNGRYASSEEYTSTNQILSVSKNTGLICINKYQKSSPSCASTGYFQTNIGYSIPCCADYQVSFKCEDKGNVFVRTDGTGGDENKLACVDSDGKNYEKYGWVNFTKETLVGGSNYQIDSYVDRCVGNELYEAYCSGLFAQIETHTCINGCENGACKISTPGGDSGTGGDINCVSSTDCPAGNFVSAASPVCDELKINVMKNYNSYNCVLGKCQSSLSLESFEFCSNGCENGVCLGDTKKCTADSECEDGMRCENGNCIGSSGDECSIDLDCNQGEYCNNGKCVVRTNDLTLTCSDSDKGKDSTVKGITKDLTSEYTDKCSLDKQSVIEYYCGGDNKVRYETISCSSGTICKNGACVKANCIDSDGGPNEKIGGHVTYQNKIYRDEMKISWWFGWIYQVKEYYCVDDKLTSGKIYCSEGGRSGKYSYNAEGDAYCIF